MALPDGAIFEAQVAGGIALYDVSHLLPAHPTLRYRRRDVDGIERVYTHHSGALGGSGFRGALGSARYVVTQRGRDGWPGAAYHFWFAHKADRDDEGRLVIYRLQPDEKRSYHTGGVANDHGLGLCWQGNLSEKLPSADQIEMAEGFYPWLLETYALTVPDGFSFHAEASRFGGKDKASCPGPHVTAWVKRWREEMAQ